MPDLDGSEDVYRAILYPHWWVEERNGPSSAAFDDAVFSVDVISRTTPQQSAARFHNIDRLAEFNCGEARMIGFDSRDEPDPAHPENIAHAHVYCLEYDALNPRQRKKTARTLAQICRAVYV
jgi:hypothetical protein